MVDELPAPRENDVSADDRFPTTLSRPVSVESEDDRFTPPKIRRGQGHKGEEGHAVLPEPPTSDVSDDTSVTKAGDTGEFALAGATDGFQAFADLMPRRASVVERLAALDAPELAKRIEEMERPREVEVFIHGMGMFEARRMTLKLPETDEG